MPDRLVTTPPPAGPIHRVARRGADPFGSPPWELAGDDGTFGGRFDDPGGRVDASYRPVAVPIQHRFRIVYCATSANGAFGETLARLRPALDDPLYDPDYEDDPDNPEPISGYLTGTRDPMDPRRGLVPETWRRRRIIATTILDPSLSFVDLASVATINTLRQALAPIARAIGLTDIDFGTVVSPNRRFTQECSRYIYEIMDEQQQPRYAGIRYLSRLNPDWQCWAIFDDRLRNTTPRQASIQPDDPALLDVAALYNLTIEASAGAYIRPA